jgi:hypothetical protein
MLSSSRLYRPVGAGEVARRTFQAGNAVSAKKDPASSEVPG